MEQNNKATVANFYSKVLGQGDLQLADSLIKEGYIQHSPMVKTGKTGIMEALTFLQQLPKPKNSPKPFVRMFGEGDFVVGHMHIELMGQQKAVIDLFRLEAGLLAEHWDVMEDIPSSPINQRPPVAGPTEIEDLEWTSRNKTLVSTFAQEVLIGRKQKWHDFLSNDLIQHYPALTDGIPPLKAYYNSLADIAVHRIIGEGNFVLTQSSGVQAGSELAIYDLYRLKAQRIVEHWSVKQAIPDQMAHANGMI